MPPRAQLVDAGDDAPRSPRSPRIQASDPQAGREERKSRGSLSQRHRRRSSRMLYFNPGEAPNGIMPAWPVCGEQLLAAGRNTDRQLGFPQPPEEASAPKFVAVGGATGKARRESRLSVLHEAERCACGWASSYVLMRDGTMMVCGLNSDGQLGIGSRENADEFTEVPGSGEFGISSIHTGAYHCFLLLHDKRALAVGCGDSGQLGTGNLDNLLTFTEVKPTFEDNGGIVDIACGGQFTLIATGDGEVYATGKNGDGQLGLGHTTQQMSFGVVPSLEGVDVTAVRAGGHHSFAVARDGSVYATGRSDEGQLGVSEGRSVFQLIEDLGQGIQDVACGWAFTYCVMRDDMVFACGRNDEGQLGTGIAGPDRTEWDLVESLVGEEIAQISCGATHAIALTIRKQVLCCGMNQDGQLGFRTKIDESQSVAEGNRACEFRTAELDDLQLVPSLSPIVSVAAGGYHSLLLSGKVYTAGHDPPRPTFYPEPTTWDQTTDGNVKAFATRRAELLQVAETDIGLVVREEQNAREHARRHYAWEGAVQQRIALLRRAEEMERVAAEFDEHGDRAAIAMRVAELDFHCHRFWETCFCEEGTERAAVKLEEEAAWRVLLAGCEVIGRTVSAQYSGRLALQGAELRQQEHIRRWMMRSAHYIEHGRYTQLYHDMTDRLRWSLEESDRVRSMPIVTPFPVELLQWIEKSKQWAADMAPLLPGTTLNQARTEVMPALRDLDAAVGRARAGEPKMMAKRDVQFNDTKRFVEFWVHELNDPKVAAVILRSDRSGGWDPAAGDWGPPGRHDELAHWEAEVSRLLAERGGVPEGYKLPPSGETGAEGMVRASEHAQIAMDKVTEWQDEYKEAVKAAEKRTNKARKDCWDLFVVPLRPWLPHFNKLDRCIQEEERLKARVQGVSEQPEEAVALAAADLLPVLSRVDSQLRALAAERVEGARQLELINLAMNAQRTLDQLRRKVSKENRKRAGLQALRQALEFGALSEADYERQRMHLEAAPERASAKARGLWELREEVRQRRLELNHAEDRVKRAQLDREEPEQMQEHMERVAGMEQVLVRAKRLLHIEQNAVSKGLEQVWQSMHPYLPDIAEEVRRLTGSELAQDIAAHGSRALPLVVDRRRGEYEFLETPAHVDSKGRQRLLWAKFNGRACVLKEYRILEVFGGDHQNAMRDFARWLGIMARMQHPSVAPVRAVFGEIDDDTSEVFHLQFDRYDTDLKRWLIQPKEGTPEELAKKVLHVMQALLCGLAFLHSPRDGFPDGVVHANVSTANILMSGDHPLFNDIEPAPEKPPVPGSPSAGLGNKRRPLEMRGTVPAYVAPELLFDGSAVRNDAPPHRPSDVYALGRTFEEVLNKCPAAEGLKILDARRGGLKMKPALTRLVEWMVKPQVAERPTAEAAAAEFGTLTRDWDEALPDWFAGLTRVEHEQDQVRAFLRELRATDPPMWAHGAAKKTAVDGDDDAPRFTIERFGVIVERRPDAAQSAQNQLRWEIDRKRSEEADARLDGALSELRRRTAASELCCPPHWGTREVDTARAPHFPPAPTPGADLEMQLIDWQTDRASLDALRQCLATGDTEAKRLVLQNAWRVENAAVWRHYADARQELRQLAQGFQCARIHMALPKGFTYAEGLRSAAGGLPGSLDESVNEAYFFLPLTAEDALQVLAYGARERFVPGYHGYELSVWEDPGACDSAEPPLRPSAPVDIGEKGVPAELHCRLYRGARKHPGEVCYMALCKVALGKAAITDDGKQNTEERCPLYPPSFEKDCPRPWPAPGTEATFSRGLAHVPLKEGKKVQYRGRDVTYHSVVVQPGAGREYRRILCYDRRRVHPEYLLSYSRDQ